MNTSQVLVGFCGQGCDSPHEAWGPIGLPATPGTHAHLLGRPLSCPQPIRAAGLSSHLVSGWSEGPRGEAGCASLMPELPGRAGE